MAHPRNVAIRRQNAELALRKEADRAAQVFGVELRQGPSLANRYPDLAAAELVENVTEFIKRITAAHESVAKPRKAG